MQRFVTIVITVLVFAAGFSFWKLANRPAGIAYQQDSSGNLSRSTDGKTPVSVVPSDLSTRDISLHNAMRRKADEQGLTDEQFFREFELIERSGKKVSSQDLRGMPYIVGFFYTTCPSICVKQNEKVQQLQTIFSGRDIRLLGISCDPEIDTPTKLTEYAKRFDADKDQWLFLTGEMDYIRRVGSEMFGLAVERRFHAEKFLLVDGEGDIVGNYAWGDPVQWQLLQADIEGLLQAGGIFPGRKEPLGEVGVTGS
ncbi:MAG TPA: SCO family protein [Planctomycetaceae bacterium]|nr:SCO family protein [Planctomycetaceae bacterium]